MRRVLSHPRRPSPAVPPACFGMSMAPGLSTCEPDACALREGRRCCNRDAQPFGGREATAFLASTDRLLLLLGEAGSGKSMFTWLTAVDHMAAFEALASNVGGGGGRVTVAVKTALALE